MAKDNFLLQWYPQGLKPYDHIPSTHPRVYINDLELAVSFPCGTPKEQQVCVGIPLGGSVNKNARPMPPEVLSGQPYCPYQLDIWQLGAAFSDFRVSPRCDSFIVHQSYLLMQSGIQAIDAVLDTLTDPNPETRPPAYDAMALLLDAMAEVTPKALMIPPTVLHDDDNDAVEDSCGPADGINNESTASDLLTDIASSALSADL